ncbi:MAG: M28 family peptidase [Desulfobacterales bacterium]|nr:M28 family peptidase [Desulfobacterales bacterium]
MLQIQNEKEYIKNLIGTIIEKCPRRQPTSEDELLSQKIMAEEFKKLNISTEFEQFTFNDNLYANIALHFGLSTAGTFISGLLPGLALIMHGLAAGSYYAESTRKAYILRRILGFKPSQNLIATLPAKVEPKLRIVIMGHADAAFTGFLFSDFMIKIGSKPTLPILKWPLALATQTSAILTVFDSLRLLLGPFLTFPLRPLEYILTIPSLLAFALNIEMVIRNEIVPGANDNLTGTAALPILANRLFSKIPENVEIVFVVTGCEEASLGGGDALARSKKDLWSKENTVIIGLDTLSNGDLHYVSVEGEIVHKPVPKWLKGILDEVIQSEDRFKKTVKGFDLFAGGTDVGAFFQHGWDGVCLINVDPKLGAPRHYHKPGDNLENLDMEKLMYSIDFAEKLIIKIIDKKG